MSLLTTCSGITFNVNYAAADCDATTIISVDWPFVCGACLATVNSTATNCQNSGNGLSTASFCTTQVDPLTELSASILKDKRFSLVTVYPNAQNCSAALNASSAAAYIPDVCYTVPTYQSGGILVGQSKMVQFFNETIDLFYFNTTDCSGPQNLRGAIDANGTCYHFEGQYETASIYPQT
ncbi:hypothetical protein HK100_000854 [Physocladia obscura]|uniref:Uncharacterized protein n=1 Tax=Physocladia obscura TaxID=109957 RepID=A0AAD5SXZ6_9FUNG|nr:hypothetical protein HK100_000854 [Physocladia obscura]